MKQKLQDAMKQAMRDKDKLRLSTIRGVLAAIQYEEMRKEKDSLSDEETLAVLKNEVKKRTEALEFAKQSGRNDLQQELEQERAVLQSFLPRQMDAVELEKVISGIIASNEGIDLGGVMKKLREQHAGLYDGKTASELVKRALG